MPVTPQNQENKHRNCVFRGNGQQVVRVSWLLDSGLFILGSATFAARIGATLEPYQLEIGTAAQGGSVEVVRRIQQISMAVSYQTVLELKKIIMIKDLSHPLNLSLKFFKEFRAKLD